MENQLYLLDTNIVIHSSRRDATQQRIEAEFGLMMAMEPPLISYVTEAEVRAMARRLGWGNARMNQLGFILTLLRRAPVENDAILDAYIEMDYYSHGAGHDMGKNDLWIAATAHATGAALITTDRDFDHLHDVFIERIFIAQG
jgi:tRNA(fMet)-specific endonuclease VapC